MEDVQKLIADLHHYAGRLVFDESSEPRLLVLAAADEITRLLAKLASAAAALASLTGERWNPATTLPPRRERVIAACRDFIIGDCFYGIAGHKLCQWHPEQMEERWRYTRDESRVPDHIQPDHWMELPAPPSALAASTTAGEGSGT